MTEAERDALLQRCSRLCGREIKRFGDLQPVEVEALLRELGRRAAMSTDGDGRNGSREGR